MLNRLRDWFEENGNNLRDWSIAVLVLLVGVAGVYQIFQDFCFLIGW
jgi:predicted negative regulator of RcsB-dependent stress response